MLRLWHFATEMICPFRVQYAMFSRFDIQNWGNLDTLELTQERLLIRRKISKRNYYDFLYIIQPLL